ncbi:MAG: ribosome-associated translation inhibitor RaiA [Chitinophagales bacterium]
MEIKLQAIHFDADQKLVDFTEKKAKKLTQFYDKIISVDIFLKFDSGNGQVRDKTADVKLNIPGNTLFSGFTSKTFEESLNKCFESLTRQLKKQKEKLKA